MSVAGVQRITIAKLCAWDAVAHSHAEIAPGAAIVNYRIHRHNAAEIEAGAAPYTVRFDWNGREYSCVLPAFQARTQAMEAAALGGAIAV